MKTIRKVPNKRLPSKVRLRLDAIRDLDEISVLDCFSGQGLVWDAVRKLSDRKIPVLGIDNADSVNQAHLHGDSLTILQSLDLSRFNLIDIDSYGSPVPHLEHLHTAGYHGRVVITYNLISTFATINTALLKRLGYPSFDQKHLNIAKHFDLLVLEYLASLGVSSFRKILNITPKVPGLSFYAWFDL